MAVNALKCNHLTALGLKLKKIVFQSKADDPRIHVFVRSFGLFCRVTLTLTYDLVLRTLDLDIVKMYLYTKMKVLGRGFEKLECDQYRHRRDRTHFHAALARLVIINVGVWESNSMTGIK